MEEVKISASTFIIRNLGELRSKYEMKEKLGEGAFGCVRKALLKGSSELRAIKTLKKSVIANTEGGTE